MQPVLPRKDRTRPSTAQIAEVKLGMTRLTNVRAGLPVDQAFNRLALELRIKLLNSILSWLDECRKEFRIC